VIEIKNVTKKYPGNIAVDHISFQVNDGEVVGFLGPNGAGKTTTMNMITGFIEPTEGQIIINGIDVSKKPKKAKKQIGYMPEGVPLYTDLTVKEFVTYMAELKSVKKTERKAKVEEVLTECGLSEVKNKLIRNISRGYKQRTGLAGALVGEPEVIILDEPTVGLDPKQIIEIRNLIKNLGKKHTVILSSHILSEVSQICEKVIIINRGKIVAIDTPANLENKTKGENRLILTVEDNNNKMETIKAKVSEINQIELLNTNDDGTKRYLVVSEHNVDLRKKLFEILSKEDIVILELKNDESTLEDAFLKLIDSKTTAIEPRKLTKEERKKAKREEKKKRKEEKLKLKAEKKKEKEEKNNVGNL